MTSLHDTLMAHEPANGRGGTHCSGTLTAGCEQVKEDGDIMEGQNEDPLRLQMQNLKRDILNQGESRAQAAEALSNQIEMLLKEQEAHMHEHLDEAYSPGHTPRDASASSAGAGGGGAGGGGAGADGGGGAGEGTVTTTPTLAVPNTGVASLKSAVGKVNPGLTRGLSAANVLRAVPSPGGPGGAGFGGDVMVMLKLLDEHEQKREQEEKLEHEIAAINHEAKEIDVRRPAGSVRMWRRRRSAC